VGWVPTRLRGATTPSPTRLDPFVRHSRALPAETQRYLAAITPQIGVTPGALKGADGTTILSMRSALEPAIPGPSDIVSAGLSATVVVHPDVPTASTVWTMVSRPRPDLSRDPCPGLPSIRVGMVRCSSPYDDPGAPRMIWRKRLSIPRRGAPSGCRTACSLHQLCA